jgi:8-oxo-dGTP pyrophosphatase MutT (NUDIX family)
VPARWPRRGDKERVFATRVFAIHRHLLVSPRTAEAHEFYTLECADWCNVVAVTAAREVVMVRQHRYGTDEETLELPGGMIDPEDASPLEAARRELREETGYEAGELVPIGSIAPNPALQTNRTWSFLARDARLVGPPACDAGEEIDVCTVPIAELPRLVRQGAISHALVVVALTYAFGLGDGL